MIGFAGEAEGDAGELGRGGARWALRRLWPRHCVGAGEAMQGAWARYAGGARSLESTRAEASSGGGGARFPRAEDDGATQGLDRMRRSSRTYVAGGEGAPVADPANTTCVRTPTPWLLLVAVVGSCENKRN